MIGSLTGVIKAYYGSQCIIDCNGVGYEVAVPSKFTEIYPLNTDATIYIELIKREDALLLYGFETLNDKLFFRQLLTVDGLGPKIAMALLSELDAAMIVDAVRSNQPTLLTRAKGVGKKIAEKIVLELKDKVSHMDMTSTGGTAVNIHGELYQTLSTLGYDNAEIAHAIKELGSPAITDDNFNSVLKECIKLIGK